MIKSKKIQDIALLWVCYMVIPMSGMSTDMYAPALVHMGHYFSVHDSWVRLTMTAFMLGFAVGQIPFGSLSDQFGRRGIFLGCLLLFSLSSFLGATTHHIGWLIVWRLCQGLACAGPSATIKGMLNDRFTGLKLKQSFSMLAVFWGIGPIVSPFIGGYIAEHLSWRAEFYTMGGVGVFYLILSSLMLVETHVDRQKMQWRHHLRNFKEILKNPLFVAYALIMGITYAFILSFHVIAPFIVEQRLSYSAMDYGYVALLLGLAWFLGSFSNRMLVGHLSTRMIVFPVVTIILIFNLLMLVVLPFIHLSLMRLLVPALCVIYLTGLTFPACMGSGVALFPKSAGSSAALMGFIAFMTTSLCTFVASLLHAHSQMPLLYLNVVFSLMMFPLGWIVFRRADS